MKFRAVMIDAGPMREFTNIVSTISKLSKECVARIADDQLYFIVSDENTGPGPPILWCEIPQAMFFSEYQMVGLDDEHKDIYLEFTSANLSRSLLTLKSAKSLKLKLTKKQCPCLTLEIEVPSSASQQTRQVTHDIPVKVIPRKSWSDFAEPNIPKPDISIELPALKQLRTTIDRMRTMAAEVMIWASAEGRLTLQIKTDTSKVSTRFKDLRVEAFEGEFFKYSHARWPTDTNKTPDLLDFFVTGGISNLYCTVESCLDGSSDHSPVLLTLSTSAILKNEPPRLTNVRTDWECFVDYFESHINLKIPLKTQDDVEDAVTHLRQTIQHAGWLSTPSISKRDRIVPNTAAVKEMVLEKRRLRRVWHNSRRREDKTALNKAALGLREYLKDIEQDSLQTKIASLSNTGKGDYSLWNIVRNSTRPQPSSPPIKVSDGSWARSELEKAEAFSVHLKNVFTPHSGIDDDKEMEREVEKYLKSDLQLSPPIKPFTPREIARSIRNMTERKAPGYDLIIPTILKHLPRKGIVFITCLFNSILRLGFFPNQWKVSEIIMVPKPGKPPNEITSHRPISLLPVISKLFEKMLIERLRPIIETEKLIPDHQFGFRRYHSTVEQVHRVADRIREAMETKEYCSAVFLDIQQAFDKVWHKGLLYKLKRVLTHNFYTILKSYIENRSFFVKYGEKYSSIHPIEAGVPQGSVLGPVLYTIYTSDLPQGKDVLIATYADDTAILSCDKNADKASLKLQKQLDELNEWLKAWRIKCSAPKSNHIVFTLNRGECPEVKLGNDILPQVDSVKYLGVHLDRRLTWKTHIKAKRDILNHKLRSMMWLLGKQSRLSLENKLLIYKVTLKPIWTYALELWSTASNSNIEILQRFQNNALKIIASAPWFTRTTEIHQYLEMSTVKEEITTRCKTYRNKLKDHKNNLARALVDYKTDSRRLKKRKILDPVV